MNWFLRWGWVFRPLRWPGWLLTLAVIAFCVQVFIAVDGRSHSVSDTLYGVFPYWACAFLLLNWIAERTQSKP